MEGVSKARASGKHNRPTVADLSTDVRDECNARVGTFNSVHAPQYKKVINKALKLALQYMSIPLRPGHTNHRLGFQKLFKSASDERFEQAVSMIKYVVKRGGTMHQALNVKLPTTGLYNPLPLPSLGLALTDAKDMYEEQARLHRGALCLTATAGGIAEAGCALDADLAHQAQDALESEVERVSGLASKANLLASMFTSGEHSLAEHLFDQQLLK
ncbi:uncharacterized protein LOC119111332 [Pollicipes pollicipes]|uniref:uncharacterized protein LOC119111332 n=1 Tax=Pollicipes pollicipes TaxID=41117 RepID=UPI001884B443|nr:uncharacterized protein LOC119111332 [Pollicipes pollicipes]